MGDIANMIIDGVLDEDGMYVGDSNEGEIIARKLAEMQAGIPVNTKIKCPICNKKVKPAGMNDHVRAVHPAGFKDN